MNKIGLGVLAISLSACTIGHEDFDCPNGHKGYGCKGLKEVHELVNNKSEGESLVTPVVTNIASAKVTADVPMNDGAIINRAREEQIRVWIAPFQDEQGNFHEPSVIHTVVRPSYWQMNLINWE